MGLWLQSAPEIGTLCDKPWAGPSSLLLFISTELLRFSCGSLTYTHALFGEVHSPGASSHMTTSKHRPPLLFLIPYIQIKLLLPQIRGIMISNKCVFALNWRLQGRDVLAQMLTRADRQAWLGVNGMPQFAVLHSLR